ncbi:MAG TPA: glucose-1-phosphate cytidylyltransferase [Mycobacteriales bacterium]|jgi:glucose-1-phosphate cytidylyltransferase|nr:glucose-1-phosphate cytidylyltransferase [Mycobacteriales bacterium]
MKVVLFCGGYGMRMREDAHDLVPKPMARVGGRPLLWHVMSWYAAWGHRDFVLCLGYGAEAVKDFFLDYRETSSNDFVLCDGEPQLLSRDVSDWRISFVDTGLNTSIGQRLAQVRSHVENEPMFLANYGDVLTDVHLPTMIDEVRSSNAAAAVLAVLPRDTFHVVDIGPGRLVRALRPVTQLGLRVNGGYFVLTPAVLDLLGDGADLVDGALARLADRGLVVAHEYDGFWVPADTVKDRAELEAMYAANHRPWAVWETPAAVAERRQRVAAAQNGSHAPAPA